MAQKLNPDSFGFLVLIALFSGLAALGTDMALSGVPLIASALSVSFGLVGGNAIQLALEPMGDIAGLASSMLSASSLGFGAVIGVVVSLLYDGTPLSTVAAMAACSALALVAYRVL
jgi:DHA1 family bicyclomycin/chloramphenicol resistance-like MFS transporter